MTQDEQTSPTNLNLAPGFAKSVSSSTRVGFIVTDGDGRIHWVNGCFEKITGCTLPDLRGRAAEALSDHVDLCPEIGDAIREALTRRAAVSASIRGCGANAGSGWKEIEIAPHYDDQNTLQFLTVVEHERKQKLDQALRSRELAAYQEALDQQAIVSVCDPSGVILFVNDRFCDVAGYAREELVGQDHRILNSGRHPAQFFYEMWRSLRSGGPWRGEICNLGKNGELFWVDMAIVPILDENGAPDRFVAIGHDVTERKTAEEALRDAERLDALTRLDNREVLLETLRHTLSRQDYDRVAGALVLIDMDHFRDINEALGHPTGDEILREIALRLRTTLRAHDTLARLGGDEFAVILRDAETPEDCAAAVNRLLNRLSDPIALADASPVEATFSVGVARYPLDARDATALLQCADIALREAKRNGRAQWCLFEPDIDQNRELRQRMVAQIRAALPQKEFTVALQPQIDLATGDVRGFEALARWTRNGKQVPPNAFIPYAEDSGLIRELGAMIMREALAAHRRMREAKLAPGVIAVNVAAQQLSSDCFMPMLKAALAEFDIAPEDVELELTETGIMGRAADRVQQTLQDARALGCTIALDDFGTGYSSLSHLHAFRPDVLKIDRRFVREIGEEGADAGLVRAMIAMAREIGVRTVAEGVENDAQAEFLRARRCHVVQGFFYARPLFINDAIAYLEARQAGAA